MTEVRVLSKFTFSITAANLFFQEIMRDDDLYSNFFRTFFVWFFISSFQRKMLALYLHHDSSVLTNVFCTQSLCSDSVCGFLNENFVTFGWDVTFSSNKTRAVNMITKHFGSVAASTLKNMDIERLPVLVLITKLRGSMEILQVL